MLQSGVPDEEVLTAWLTDLHYEEYFHLFRAAGYDMPTISRCALLYHTIQHPYNTHTTPMQHHTLPSLVLVQENLLYHTVPYVGYLSQP